MAWTELQKDFIRVSQNRPCPICGHTDWCCISKTATEVLCPRTKSNIKTKCGYLHKLDPVQANVVRNNMVIPNNTSHLPCVNIKKLNDHYMEGLTKERLTLSSQALCIRESALLDMNIGWDVCRGMMTFPMVDEDFHLLGILRRSLTGEKRVIKGSRVGAFVPCNFRMSPGVTFVAEGATDTAAVNELGLNVIGRFNCWTGEDVLKSYLEDHTVYVLADNDKDGAGVEGARTLAAQLVSVSRSIRVIILPDKYKDLREMKIQLGHLPCLKTLIKLCKG